ncbi:MAG: MaoC/PaaZ C-terminal domain-containing protein [Actinomycetota bacterium]
MALNADLVGKKYDETTYEVTANAIEKYARATNDENDSYLGGDDVVAPPVFPIVPAGTAFVAPLFDPELQVNFLRLVHGSEEHIFHKPLRAGDKLRFAAEVESIEQKESGETLTLRSDLYNQDDELAVTVRGIMFIRGKGGGGNGKPADEEPQGDVVYEETTKVDDDQTFRYAEASGDHNPIHTDENAAKMAGLPGIILHGMCSMAFAAKAAVNGLAEGDPTRIKRVFVRLSKPVLPGQELTTKFWAVSDGDGTKAYGFETYNPDGVAVIKAGEVEIA